MQKSVLAIHISSYYYNPVRTQTGVSKKKSKFQFCEDWPDFEGISLAPVSNRSCDSAHPPSGSIFLLVYQKLFEAKISTVGGAFPAI